jgi:hypothetical protein
MRDVRRMTIARDVALRLTAALALCAALAGPAAADLGCGELTPPAGLPGPYDYRNPPKQQLEFVTRFHFTPDVEALRKGASSVNIGGDISFALMIFPNHHRALVAMSRLAQKLKTPQPPGAVYPVDCYFERAVRFRPDDMMVHGILGMHLLQTGNVKDAIRELETARAALPDDANVAYNLGLAYFDARDYGKSLENAKRAYALGFPLPGLRDKLRRAGKWSD